MTAWIYSNKNGIPINKNCFDLYTGFKELGEEVKTYNYDDFISDNLSEIPQEPTLIKQSSL